MKKIQVDKGLFEDRNRRPSRPVTQFQAIKIWGL